MAEIIKAVKGFNQDMTCTPTDDDQFQYEEGKTYEEELADVCNKGFHACELPINAFRYYPPTKSVYHEVEMYGETDNSGTDKTCSSKIKIGAKINIAGIIKASIDIIRGKAEKESSASSGDYGNAASSLGTRAMPPLWGLWQCRQLWVQGQCRQLWVQGQCRQLWGLWQRRQLWGLWQCRQLWVQGQCRQLWELWQCRQLWVQGQCRQLWELWQCQRALGTRAMPPALGTMAMPPALGTRAMPPALGTMATPPALGTVAMPPALGTVDQQKQIIQILVLLRGGQSQRQVA